jgi:hypothetical protein
MMVEAKSRGFEVVLIYIGTESVEINLARIKNRVLQGGHDVPEKDVRRRYQRSFRNLPIALARADHTILFDNSTEEGYRRLSEKLWFEPIPALGGSRSLIHRLNLYGNLYARLKYCTARSCFSAAVRVENVPRFLRFPVFASFLRE